MREFKLSEVCSFLEQQNIKYRINTLEDCCIYGFCSLVNIRQGKITWIKSHTDNCSSITAGIVICSHDLDLGASPRIIAIRVENPRYVFIRLMQKFGQEQKCIGIAETAIIGSDCRIGENTYIGHYVVLGKNVTVGDSTIINSHVAIYDNTIVGSNCIIHSGAVIGADGFGYERDSSNKLHKFPHIGKVIIEDDVEIGANTCIDRAALDNTIIRRGAKIDNLCHIAHNVVIGENSLIIAESMIGGSTVIEPNCWIAPGARIKESLTIGRNSTVGMGAVVLGNVGENNIVAGIPARTIRKL